jgi:RimJ/RimL family protein N-acetyltransferase
MIEGTKITLRAIEDDDKAYWGQGYGGEAVELLLRIAFNGFNLHKVWPGCFDFNERGLRTYRRVGFVEEGRLRDEKYVDGRYHDLILMAMLEDEWRERQQQ